MKENAYQKALEKAHQLAIEFLERLDIDPVGVSASYEDLKAKLEQVLSTAGTSLARADEVDLSEVPFEPNVKPKAVKPKKEYDLEEEEDESLSYFAKLANDD